MDNILPSLLHLSTKDEAEAQTIWELVQLLYDKLRERGRTQERLQQDNERLRSMVLNARCKEESIAMLPQKEDLEQSEQVLQQSLDRFLKRSASSPVIHHKIEEEKKSAFPARLLEAAKLQLQKLSNADCVSESSDESDEESSSVSCCDDQSELECCSDDGSCASLSYSDYSECNSCCGFEEEEEENMIDNDHCSQYDGATLVELSDAPQDELVAAVTQSLRSSDSGCSAIQKEDVEDASSYCTPIKSTTNVFDMFFGAAKNQCNQIDVDHTRTTELNDEDVNSTRSSNSDVEDPLVLMYLDKYEQQFDGITRGSTRRKNERKPAPRSPISYPLQLDNAVEPDQARKSPHSRRRHGSFGANSLPMASVAATRPSSCGSNRVQHRNAFSNVRTNKNRKSERRRLLRARTAEFKAQAQAKADLCHSPEDMVENSEDAEFIKL